jgi:hypothetical protein
MPYVFPNLWSFVLDRLPEGERNLVRSWGKPSECREILYPGCSVIITAYLTQTELLSELEVRGSLEHCCGEMYYRMGMFEQVELIGKRLEEFFKVLGVRKVITACPACCDMLTNVLPAFGAKFEFEVESLLEWIWRKVEGGEIRFTSKVKKLATIQDSCHGKVLGRSFLELPRRLLEAVGVKVVEMEYSGMESPCCGIGAGFSPASGFHPLHIQMASVRRLNEARRTGAEILVVYCAGCLLMFSVVKLLYPIRMQVYHLLEILQMATGEKPLRHQASRAMKLIMGVLRHQFPKLLSRKRLSTPKLVMESNLGVTSRCNVKSRPRIQEQIDLGRERRSL